MANDVVHFAIHADDCERARRFYEGVFGWRFEAWGPPGFWLIRTRERGVQGALHERHEPVTGTGMIGFECTISVEDVKEMRGRIERAGGAILTEPFHIEGVGTVLRFSDTEGNVVGAMQYTEGLQEGDQQ